MQAFESRLPASRSAAYRGRPWSWLLALTCCALIGGRPSAVLALDLTQSLKDLHHTSWTAKDGLSGAANCLAQTSDGYLWIGTTDGLFRFDGHQFERWRPDRGELIAASVSTLHAVPDGGLWIGYQRGGASFVRPDGRLVNYSEREGLPVGRVRTFAIDHDGVVWVGAVGGVAWLEGDRWRRLRGGDMGLTSRSAWSMTVDREGTLWVAAASPHAIFFKRRAEPRFHDTGVKASGWGLMRAEDGTLLFMAADYYEDHVQALTVDKNGQGTLRTVLRKAAGLGLALDRHGGLWVPAVGVIRASVADLLRQPSQAGVKPGRMGEPPPEHFFAADGLSGQIAAHVIEDREGNIWVATEGGLDRFRHRNLTWRSLDQEPSAVAALAAGGNGEVWATSQWKPWLRRLRDHAIVPGVPDVLNFGYTDRDGTVWLAGGNGLWHWKDGRFIKIDPPEAVRANKTLFTILSAAVDRTGRHWLAISGAGQYMYKDGVWTFRPILPGRDDMTAVGAHADEDDRVWLAYRDEIAKVDGDQVRIFSARDGLEVAPLLTVTGVGGRVWVGGELGLAVFHNDRFHTVRFSRDTRIGTISGIVSTPDDGVWLHAGSGIVHVPRAEVDKLASNPAHPVNEERFDTISDLPDQLHTRITGLPVTTAVRSSDGLLWFITARGYARIDPKRVYRNPLPPPVSIRAVVADDRRYPARSDLALPALTRTIQIDFAALSLSIPERLQFRYRLEGWETEWHDAGQRRSAFYTELGPGKYTFRVIASNNDGVWNEAGAALVFSVTPAWYQTTWFLGGATALGVALLWGLYLLRVRQIGAALSARFDARLAERTRIARDLHDTLLQTVQASKIIADTALARVAPPQDGHALRQLSEWLGQAVLEGRAALNSLRVSSVSLTDLAQAFRAAADSIPMTGRPLAVSVSVYGEPHTLHPAIREDVFRIGYEAIRNACAHSQGTQVSVAIDCGYDLVVRVTDDGIGILPSVTTGGKAGHFGLSGMRERAAEIGATLKVLGSETGTSVVLTVPGHIAFWAGGRGEPA